MTEHSKKKIYNVKPLKTAKEIKDVENVLKMQGQYYDHKIGRRNLMIFDFGIFTGLRVSDLVRLRADDITNTGAIILREKKTGKISKTSVNKKLMQELKRYENYMSIGKHDYLFPGRQKNSKKVKNGTIKHITTQQVYHFLQQAGKVLGRNDLGCHTMRKTFARRYYDQTGDIATLQKLLNHSSQAVTLRYIGVEQEDLRKSLADFDPTK